MATELEIRLRNILQEKENKIIENGNIIEKN